MIIKIIPENEEEKKRIRESEHVGVTDFFVCGERKDGDGDAIDFHEWSGKYPKLIGPLFYYAYYLINEQNMKNMSAKATESFIPPKTPFIKRDAMNFKDADIKQVDTQNIQMSGNPTVSGNGNPVLKFPPVPEKNVVDVQPVYQEELPIEDTQADDESKGAEDN